MNIIATYLRRSWSPSNLVLSSSEKSLEISFISTESELVSISQRLSTNAGISSFLSNLLLEGATWSEMVIHALTQGTSYTSALRSATKMANGYSMKMESPSSRERSKSTSTAERPNSRRSTPAISVAGFRVARSIW